jgi:hypothetical protein
MTYSYTHYSDKGSPSRGNHRIDYDYEYVLTDPTYQSLNELATPWYSDQILPFDITLAGANEYGAMLTKLFGIEILNEGTGHSIDDPVTEMQATFVARAIEPMQAVPSKFDGIGN